MLLNFLKRVVEDIVGKQSSYIVDLLAGKKNVNEFLIAKKLKLSINQTRNILYRLSDRGLVSFIRKKDKRKGWYIYFWTLNALKCLQLLEKKLLKEVFQLENKLKNREVKSFYYCKTCDIEVSGETALLNQFICPECEQVYELVESDKPINVLKNRIDKVKKDLELIREEKEKIEKKEDRKRKRRDRLEKEEKKRKRKRGRKKSEAKKKKEEKKNKKKRQKKTKKKKTPKKTTRKKTTKKKKTKSKKPKKKKATKSKKSKKSKKRK